MSLNTTPRTWVSGEVVTAAEMNTEIRDALTGVQAAWSTYVPVWTGSVTNPVIGNGTIEGRWQRLGKSAPGVFIRITLGSTTTVGSGNYSVTLPANLLSVRGAMLDGELLDTSSGNHYGIAGIVTAVGVLTMTNAGASPMAFLTAVAPVVPATGDVYMLNGTMEIA